MHKTAHLWEKCTKSVPKNTSPPLLRSPPSTHAHSGSCPMSGATPPRMATHPPQVGEWTNPDPPEVFQDPGGRRARTHPPPSALRGGGSGEPTFGVPILDPKKTIWRFTPKIEETPSSGRVPTQPDLPPPQRRGLGRDQPPPFGSQHLRKFLLP